MVSLSIAKLFYRIDHDLLSVVLFLNINPNLNEAAHSIVLQLCFGAIIQIKLSPT